MRKGLNGLQKQGFSMCNAMAAQDSTFKKYFKFKSLYKYEKKCLDMQEKVTKVSNYWKCGKSSISKQVLISWLT